MAVKEGTPPRAALHGGVWLPEGEEHFADMMLRNKKRMRVINGKHTYQYHKLEAAMELQPKDRRSVCIDIGAHVGLWAMWLTDFFDKVIAFEPVPQFATIFPYNVDMTKVELHEIALGDSFGEVTISIPVDMTGNSHIAIPGKSPDRRDGHGPVDQVKGVSLQPLDSMEFGAVDFIKIDVEGYELPVVRGAEKTIRKFRPNIVIEQKGNDTSYGDKRGAAVEFLQSLGMRSMKCISGDHIMGWN